MENVVCDGVIRVWCGVPSSGPQGHSSWWPLQYETEIFWKIINVFAVTGDKFDSSLLKEFFFFLSTMENKNSVF